MRDGVVPVEIAAAGAEFQVRGDVTFLNHGSFGACPLPVFAAYQRWQRELEAEPVAFLGRELPGLLAEARGALAAYVGTSADNVVFVPNATHGVNIVARSLDLLPGDEVLGTDHEYGAVMRTWRFICAQHGATYRAARIPLPVTSPEEIVEAIWREVTGRTRAIIVSHITSPTALIFPVAEICRRARAAGILTIVDGAHAPGQIDLALDDLGADFYTGNLHKWLCGPKGAAFLYARPERQAMLRPLVVSWGWDPERPGDSPFQDVFGWTGTDDPSAYLTVPAAIAFQRQHDWPRVRAWAHHLLGSARERIGALTGLPQIAPDSPEWWGQMAAIPLPPFHMAGSEMQRRLYDEFAIEVPIVEWEGQRFVRVSIQAYNTPADVERLVDALARAL